MEPVQITFNLALRSRQLNFFEITLVLNTSVFPSQLFFFFFQPEDGIRDVLGSRGLGDVYKRQDYQGISV